MLRKILVVPFFLIGTIVHAQTTDSLAKATCDYPFIISETMPYLKNGIPAFEDSLTNYLHSINALPKEGSVSLHITITRSGDVTDVAVIKSDFENNEAFVNALYAFQHIWVGGTQNKHQVCVYRRVQIQFSSDKTIVTFGMY